MLPQEAAVGSGTFPGPRPDFFLLEMLLEVDPEPSEASMSPDSVASGSGPSKSTPTSPSDDDSSSGVDWWEADDSVLPIGTLRYLLPMLPSESKKQNIYGYSQFQSKIIPNLSVTSYMAKNNTNSSIKSQIYSSIY